MSNDVGIDIPIISQMGAEILSETGNTIKVKMPLAQNTNHVGIMYAGSLFTLAEFPPGVLFVKRMDMTRVVPIVAELNIRFKRPAMTDIYAQFEFEDSLFEALQSEALEKGKASFKHEQALTDENGEVVAVTTARYVILKAP